MNRLQARAELDRTFERLHTEYQMDPERWTPEPLPEGFDAEDTRKRLDEARDRYRGLGAVNLLAVEEYEKKKERYDFLKQQRADVESARGQLLEAIEKINVTASQLFRETRITSYNVCYTKLLRSARDEQQEAARQSALLLKAAATGAAKFFTLGMY